jgi:hypothetical protein
MDGELISGKSKLLTFKMDFIIRDISISVFFYNIYGQQAQGSSHVTLILSIV